MRFGKLDIDPARNPAVLDTATWAPDRAWQVVVTPPPTFWQTVWRAADRDEALFRTPGISPLLAARVCWQGSTFCPAALADGQQLLLEFGAGCGAAVLGEPLGRLSLDEEQGQSWLTAYRADLETVARYVQAIDPDKAPRAMGAEPRLGIGCRMTTASWPGIYRAMREGGFAANAIQNSVREANVLEDLLEARPAVLNYGPNLGVFGSGHAGSSFEGLWVYGVLEALRAPGRLRYGADADHMQVKRDPAGLERALRVLESVRHYTFYTMDVSDILDYAALGIGPAEAGEAMQAKAPNSGQRRQILAYHNDPYRVAGQALVLDEADVGRYVAKYWDAFEAMGRMTERIGQLKGDQPYDLEFAVDETPPGVRACDSITSPGELLFVMRECRRRGLPVTHVAPNFGIEKEVDYRCSDGLAGLAERVRVQTAMASDFGLMLDYHSGDDLSGTTRRTIGRASGGENQFKVSPYLQLLFAETLADLLPDVFRVWWDDTLTFSRQQAAGGSALAIAGLRALEASADPSPGAQHSVFRHYCFASLGRRDQEGQYVHREMLYGGLSAAFHAEYTDRLAAYLAGLADDLFRQSSV